MGAQSRKIPNKRACSKAIPDCAAAILMGLSPPERPLSCLTAGCSEAEERGKLIAQETLGRDKTRREAPAFSFFPSSLAYLRWPVLISPPPPLLFQGVSAEERDYGSQDTGKMLSNQSSLLLPFSIPFNIPNPLECVTVLQIIIIILKKTSIPS